MFDEMTEKLVLSKVSKQGFVDFFELHSCCRFDANRKKGRIDNMATKKAAKKAPAKKAAKKATKKK